MERLYPLREINNSATAANLPPPATVPLSTELIQQDVLHTLGANAAAIIHELRNPLQTIRAYLQIHERKLAPFDLPANVTDLRPLYGEIERMNSLMSQFLRLSRFAPDSLQKLNLAEAICELKPLLHCMAVVRGVELVAELPDNPRFCLGDEQALKQLLLNLLGNALDACAAVEQPQVRICLSYEGAELVLSVRDNGCGIAPEAQERIWQPFITNKPGGTGLGLPACAQIARDHGGVLGFTSNYGEGSCFYLRLPAVEV